MKNRILGIRYENSFNKDVKKITKQGKDLDKLFQVMNYLALGTNLEKKYCDHPLKGKYKGLRECHITPDWLLIYRVEEDTVVLSRTGSHSELF